MGFGRQILGVMLGARWANAARMAPSELLQQLAALARQDELRFEVDPKPTLTFQVRTDCPPVLHACKHQRMPMSTSAIQERMQLSGLHAR